jgi:catechol-2,3-dioxygenase
MTHMPARPAHKDAASTKVSPVKLSHIFFVTRRIAPMRDWYVKVFDAAVAFENSDVCFLKYDDEHHRIAIAAVPHAQAPTDPVRVGTGHVAFTYRDLDALAWTYRRLKRDGIEPFWTINHGVTTSMYYRDPDGNSIELQIDNFATEAEADAFVAAHLHENPVGIIIDPDELIARHEAGVPFEELRRRPALPAGKTPADMIRM